MRAAAALLLLAGSAHGTTLGPLSSNGQSIATDLKSLSVTSGTTTFSFALEDESVSSSGVYTYEVEVDPAPTSATCTDVLDALVDLISKKQSKGTKVAASAPGCSDTAPVEATGSRRRAALLAATATITATPPAPSAAPTTSSPTTAAPTTAAPTTATPTTSCPDKYGAAVCAPFLAEGLCKEELAQAWCRASCGMCNSCMFAEKKVCKERDDCKWGKKKKVCKAKKSCADLSKKKCNKADNCKWKKKAKACKAKNPCKLSKKACKKSDACKWKNKKCKAKKAKAGRSASALSASSNEESSDESVSDDSSESED